MHRFKPYCHYSPTWLFTTVFISLTFIWAMLQNLLFTWLLLTYFFVPFSSLSLVQCSTFFVVYSPTGLIPFIYSFQTFHHSDDQNFIVYSLTWSVNLFPLISFSIYSFIIAMLNFRFLILITWMIINYFCSSFLTRCVCSAWKRIAYFLWDMIFLMF